MALTGLLCANRITEVRKSWTTATPTPRIGSSMNCLGTKHLDLTTESADAVRTPGATASSSV
jgi:hypothetical protein